MCAVFDSRRAEFRSPLGAVPTGGTVTMTARPESYRFPLRGFLCAHFEPDGPRIELPMTHLGHSINCEEFQVEFPCGDTPGLWFYSFRFENDGGSFWYGARRGHTGGPAMFYGADYPPEFQLTVFKDDPQNHQREWLGEGVVYQIFPDRFSKGGEIAKYSRLNERIIHSDWSEEPLWRPEQFEGAMQMTNRDFFGGTLTGIRSRLDYLESLGVTTIYLNPIFESFSNHHYDTADYTSIDPSLGSEEDFRELCRSAHERGMHIILDGVFNHTGSDSIYFNRRGHYPEPGAYQSTDSKWSSWYEFTSWPNVYSCWWGIVTLPQTRDDDPSFRDFIAGGSESVVRRWLNAGADGWRLDVADELSDDFIRGIASAAHKEKDSAIVIGEVWEDASNKISYGARRKYLLGGALDGVTGYPFRSAVLAYLGGGDASEFEDALSDILENYPMHALLCSLNILGTHDTPRILTALGAPSEFWQGGREKRSEAALSDTRYFAARTLVKLGALLQYSFIGAPCVYYGDEAGMQGGEDPFNRRTFPWGGEDRELTGWYRRLGALRRSESALTRGTLRFVAADGAVLCYLRECANSQPVYAAVNRASASQTLTGLPDGSYIDLMGSGLYTVCERSVTLPAGAALLLVRK